MENTTHAIKVGGQDITGHTAKPLDPNNPPKRPAKTDAQETLTVAAPKAAGK